MPQNKESDLEFWSRRYAEVMTRAAMENGTVRAAHLALAESYLRLIAVTTERGTDTGRSIHRI